MVLLPKQNYTNILKVKSSNTSLIILRILENNAGLKFSLSKQILQFTAIVCYKRNLQCAIFAFMSDIFWLDFMFFLLLS